MAPSGAIFLQTRLSNPLWSEANSVVLATPPTVRDKLLMVFGQGGEGNTLPPPSEDISSEDSLVATPMTATASADDCDGDRRGSGGDPAALWHGEGGSGLPPFGRPRSAGAETVSRPRSAGTEAAEEALAGTWLALPLGNPKNDAKKIGNQVVF